VLFYDEAKAGGFSFGSLSFVCSKESEQMVIDGA